MLLNTNPITKSAIATSPILLLHFWPMFVVSVELFFSTRTIIINILAIGTPASSDGFNRILGRP
jgi:hypothetical protein